MPNSRFRITNQTLDYGLVLALLLSPSLSLPLSLRFRSNKRNELNTENGQTMQTILDKQENIIFIGDDLIICFAEQCERLNGDDIDHTVTERAHCFDCIVHRLPAIAIESNRRTNCTTIDWKWRKICDENHI